MTIISKHGRWIVSLVAAPVACVMLYLALPLAPTSPPAPRYVSVAFAGYTNDAVGRQFGQFTISNLSPFHVECSVVGPQIQTNRAWVWLPGYSSPVLKPEEVINVVVEPPKDAVPWRFAVFAVRPPPRIQTGIDKLESWLPRRLYRLLRADPRRSHLVRSQLFEQGKDKPNKEDAPNNGLVTSVDNSDASEEGRYR